MSQANSERPIVIRKIKKGGHGGHHGGAWKVAYADFVTAMMAFFMLLWLISNPDKERLKGLAEYFNPAPPSEPIGRDLGKKSAQGSSAGASNQGQESSPDQAMGGGTADIPQSSLNVMAQEMKTALDSASSPEDQAQVKVEPVRNGVRISLVDSARRPMFKGQTAQLNDYALATLANVARKIAPLGSQIAIEGHTDASGGQSAANWRLSGERALAAQAALLQAGLPGDRVAEVIARAASQPLFPDQPERPENRRIVITIIAKGSTLPKDVSFRF